VSGGVHGAKVEGGDLRLKFASRRGDPSFLGSSGAGCCGCLCILPRALAAAAAVTGWARRPVSIARDVFGRSIGSGLPFAEAAASTVEVGRTGSRRKPRKLGSCSSANLAREGLLVLVFPLPLPLPHPFGPPRPGASGHRMEVSTSPALKWAAPSLTLTARRRSSCQFACSISRARASRASLG
jgi:hypothetical protein